MAKSYPLMGQPKGEPTKAQIARVLKAALERLEHSDPPEGGDTHRVIGEIKALLERMKEGGR